MCGQDKSKADARWKLSERALAAERIKAQKASRRMDELQDQVTFFVVVAGPVMKPMPDT